MRLTSAYPGGRRLLPGNHSKYRGLMFQRGTPDGSAQTESQFHAVWDWDNYIKPQIDLIKASGANAIKGWSGVVAAGNGTITRQTLIDHNRQFLDYCASIGLWCYYCLWDSDGPPAQTTPDTVGHAVALTEQVLEGQTNVIGIDLGNEIVSTWAYGPTDGLKHLATLHPPIKAVTSIPLTVGLLVGQTSDLTSSLTRQVMAYCDIVDWHPYWGSGNMTPADLTAWRASDLYKPWIVGECGSNSPTHSVVQSRWESLGVLAEEYDCWGVMGYETLEHQISPGYGMYPSLTSPANSWMITPFQTWPAR